jgi:hypothetical protein
LLHHERQGPDSGLAGRGFGSLERSWRQNAGLPRRKRGPRRFGVRRRVITAGQ